MPARSLTAIFVEVMSVVVGEEFAADVVDLYVSGGVSIRPCSESLVDQVSDDPTCECTVDGADGINEGQAQRAWRIFSPGTEVPRL